MTKKNEELTKIARVNGLCITVFQSTVDTAGKYLAYDGHLPMTGLGWTKAEAKEEIRKMAAMNTPSH